MVKLRMDRKVVERLASFLQPQSAAAPRSNHWQHFSRLNSIFADASTGIVTFSAGAGFDSDYELNFRRRSLRETAGRLWRHANGTDPDSRYSKAFSSLWPNGSPVTWADTRQLLGAPMTAHKILAAHYASLLLPAVPESRQTTYVEIGPGAGYLATLMHQRRPGLLITIDLPEVLPFSVLALHRAFPGSPFWLPNEISGGAPITLPEQGLLFLTPDQACQLPDMCLDVGVNTASFGEMLPEHIATYFALLRRITKPTGLFFTCNRVEKWMDREGTSLHENAPGHGLPVRFDRYPWLLQDRDVFYGPSALHAITQPQNPMLIRLCHLASAQTQPSDA